MRFVANTPDAGDVDAALLPSAERLESARRLQERFPSAALREVVMLPCPGESRARVRLAVESMQVTGSFKVRGALAAIAARLEAARASGEPLRVVAASAGNHGAGVAYAAKVLGAAATVVVSRSAPRAKVDKIARYGAEVVRAAEEGYDAAELEAMALAQREGAAFVSPYDDLDVLAGNGASLAFEIARALGGAPPTVLCPIGGGGLATGLACAFAHDARGSATRVFGVQSEASPAFAMSLERGAAVTSLPPAISLADGLEGGISARAFARARAVVAGAFVVSEEAIARAMGFAYRELGLVLEGSAAAALAPVLDPRGRAAELDGDVVVVLTGRNVDPERLAAAVEDRPADSGDVLGRRP